MRWHKTQELPRLCGVCVFEPSNTPSASSARDAPQRACDARVGFGGEIAGMKSSCPRHCDRNRTLAQRPGTPFRIWPQGTNWTPLTLSAHAPSPRAQRARSSPCRERVQQALRSVSLSNDHHQARRPGESNRHELRAPLAFADGARLRGRGFFAVSPTKRAAIPSRSRSASRWT